MTEPGAHQFDTISSRDVHIGQILGMRVDEVRMPGGDIAKREIVEHLGAVAIVALTDDDEIVMIHQYRHPLARRIWELPAGLLDYADESPLDTARRELAEEVGLQATQWDTLVDVAASPGFTDQVVRVYVARNLSPVGRNVLGEEEADLVIRNVPISEAVRMVFSGELINGEAVAGVLAANAAISGAVSLRPADTPWTDRPTRFAARNHR